MICAGPVMDPMCKSNKRPTLGLQATVYIEEEETAVHRDTVIIDIDGTMSDPKGPSRPLTMGKCPWVSSNVDEGEDTDETSYAALGLSLEIIH